jgi:hypothetical protein
MPFDTTTITSVDFEIHSTGLIVSWASTAELGTTYQVYVNAKLAWHGLTKTVTLPYPTDRIKVDVGTVGPGEGSTDFSADLPVRPADKAELAWLGGTYQDATGSDDIQGFKVYSSGAVNDYIDYDYELGSVEAYPGGIITDGFGLGGFGQGGFGRSASEYAGATNTLENGVWQFAIKPYDSVGNLGAASTVQIVIDGPPWPPAPYLDGSRLTYTYQQSVRQITLNWNASPG